MLGYTDFDELSLPVQQAYTDMEMRLIEKIVEHLVRSNGEVSGSVEWWLKKLHEMGALRREVVDEIEKTSNLSTAAIQDMIEKVVPRAVDYDYYTKAFEEGVAKTLITDVNFERVLGSSYLDTLEKFELLHTQSTEGAQNAFVKAVTQAHIETSSGTYSYDQAIERSVRELADKGITAVELKTKSGATRNYSIESVVRTTTMTGISHTANNVAEELVSELGAEHVAVSQHYGARAVGEGYKNHEQWQGKVYSLLPGGDSEFPGFVESTGYGEPEGLGGVNCRHTFFAYFPGISIPHKKEIDDELNSHIFAITQRKRALERSVREAKRRIEAFKVAGDEENVQKSKQLLKRRIDRLQNHINEHSEYLSRDFERERIYI